MLTKDKVKKNIIKILILIFMGVYLNIIKIQ